MSEGQLALETQHFCTISMKKEVIFFIKNTSSKNSQTCLVLSLGYSMFARFKVPVCAAVCINLKFRKFKV